MLFCSNALRCAVIAFLAIACMVALGMGRSFAQTTYQASQYRVIDGDSVQMTMTVYPGIEVSDNFRIEGIDAPELRGKCEEEKGLANTAKAALSGLLADADILLVTVFGKDKYGRPLALLHADDTEVGAWMIEQGYARPYDGKARGTWCNNRS